VLGDAIASGSPGKETGGGAVCLIAGLLSFCSFLKLSSKLTRSTFLTPNLSIYREKLDVLLLLGLFSSAGRLRTNHAALDTISPVLRFFAQSTTHRRWTPIHRLELHFNAQMR
jgi:hypothetical protein